MAKLSVTPKSNSQTAVAAAMQEVLTSTFNTYLLTHQYHWNVEGPQFYNLHKLFEDQYNELWTSIDEIAERIRALGAYAMPQGEAALSKQAGRYASVTEKKAANADASARKMLEQLVDMNEETMDAAQKTKELAEKAGDDESVDVMVGRITAHQKAVWMLKSLLK